MRVAMFTTSFPKFPTDSHAPWILAMAEAIARQGHGVKVVCPSATDIPANDCFGSVKVVRFRYMFKPMECVAYGANIPANVASNFRAKLSFPFFILGFFLSGVRDLYESDIIHAQFGYSGVFAALTSMIVRRETPLLVSFYGRDVAHAFKHRHAYRLCFRRARRVLVLSEDMKQTLNRAGCPNEKLIVHHLGVDCERFDGNRMPSPAGLVSFLIVANFVPKKGISNSIESFARLARERDDVCLKIIGRGPLETALKRRAVEHQVGDKVRFINNYETEDPRGCVLKAMRRADIFILTSVTAADDYGGTPIVLMEAGAMGLPTITTANSGNAEIVCHRKTGLVVPENDPDQLYHAMKLLVQSPEKRKEYGTAARNYIYHEFNEKTQMQRLEKLYEGVNF